jgi:hypothetical protein
LGGCYNPVRDQSRHVSRRDAYQRRQRIGGKVHNMGDKGGKKDKAKSQKQKKKKDQDKQRKKKEKQQPRVP